MQHSWWKYPIAVLLASILAYTASRDMAILLVRASTPEMEVGLFGTRVYGSPRFFAFFRVLEAITIALLVSQSEIRSQATISRSSLLWESAKFATLYELLTRSPMLLFVMSAQNPVTIKELTTVILFDLPSVLLQFHAILSLLPSTPSKKIVDSVTLKMWDDRLTFHANYLASASLSSAAMYAIQKQLITRPSVDAVHWNILQPGQYGGVWPLFAATLPAAIASQLLVVHFYPNISPLKYALLLLFVGLTSGISVYSLIPEDVYTATATTAMTVFRDSLLGLHTAWTLSGLKATRKAPPTRSGGRPRKIA